MPVIEHFSRLRVALCRLTMAPRLAPRGTVLGRLGRSRVGNAGDAGGRCVGRVVPRAVPADRQPSVLLRTTVYPEMVSVETSPGGLVICPAR
jgi:hypothetical protein